MCGIVGYIGKEGAVEVLLDGLARLEYRGYDSAGVALQNGNGIHVIKRAGRLKALNEALDGATLRGPRLPLGDGQRGDRPPPRGSVPQA